MEPWRLPGAGARALRRLPYAAQFPRRGEGRAAARRRRGAGLVRLRAGRRLAGAGAVDRGQPLRVPAARLAGAARRRAGADGRGHGRPGRRAGRRRARDRHLYRLADSARQRRAPPPPPVAAARRTRARRCIAAPAPAATRAAAARRSPASTWRSAAPCTRPTRPTWPISWSAAFPPPARSRAPIMPGFGAVLTDRQMADLLDLAARPFRCAAALGRHPRSGAGRPLQRRPARGSAMIP